jgi:hypothetical protein
MIATQAPDYLAFSTFDYVENGFINSGHELILQVESAYHANPSQTSVKRGQKQ